jgi:hypothetical protein
MFQVLSSGIGAFLFLSNAGLILAEPLPVFDCPCLSFPVLLFSFLRRPHQRTIPVMVKLVTVRLAKKARALPGIPGCFQRGCHSSCFEVFLRAAFRQIFCFVVTDLYADCTDW